ncbi:MAG: hypothetical protein MUE40_02660 [Anaerolineae bacterium]|jgi:hypothetical protein|nr:hypothetical protein [Anaerolineae bacterium]
MLNDEQMAKLTELQAKYAPALMRYPHVIGVGIGIAMRDGQYTDEPALVVMVDLKLPQAQLILEDILPRELEGVRVDVQATGVFTAF